MVVIIVAAFSIGNLIISDDNSDRPLNVAMFDSGLNVDHIFREDIEIKDYSFAKEAYGYSKDFSATQDGTDHGDAVFGIFMENLRYKNNIVFHNIRVIDNQIDSIIQPEALFAAILFATESLSIDIAILSLGSAYIAENFDRFLFDPFIDANILVVAAAGNSGLGDSYQGVIASPAIYPDIVAVGAYLDNDVEDYSSRGPTAFRTMKPDVIATHERADILRGTSFTAPAAAAVAADIMIDYHIKNDQIPSAGYTKLVLMEGAVHSDSTLLLSEGAGKVNLDGSVEIMDTYSHLNYSMSEIFSVFPNELPITPDFVWDGLQYTFSITITHASKITDINDLEIEYLGTNQIFYNHEFYSDYTSLLRITFVAHDKDTNEIILRKGNFEKSISINYIATIPDKIIYFNSLMTDFASSSTRYGTYNLLFQLLADQNIALIDDPLYSDIDNVLLIEPWSLFEDSTYNPLLEDITNKNILSLYSIFNENGDADFNNRGWNVNDNVLSETIEIVDIAYKNQVFSIPYFGWSLVPMGPNQQGKPITIVSGSHAGTVVGLIDAEWTSLLTNIPFTNDALLGLSNDFDDGFFDNFDFEFITILFELFDP
ncbi:MAG: Serine protease AprX [Candidatus Heimdallarchaeota archaeon LC_2]|nr:MAG: Serine protease AprX [Candidatus Heimdallarchaeota archaeon LC_2]